jgi:CheY-like chemotaxis protein
LADALVSVAGVRVLVVEDEAMVLMLLQDQLAEIGCEVVGTASRFDDAVKKAKSLTFDVAILDVNLKGQYIFPIADLLAERGVAFVFSTGYGVTSLPEPLRGAPVLQKPFTQRDLDRALRVALMPASPLSFAQGGEQHRR